MSGDPRPVGEVLILLIAGTICLTVLLAGAGVAIVELLQPDRDTSRAVAMIADTLNTLIGLLAGYVAGRQTRTPPD